MSDTPEALIYEARIKGLNIKFHPLTETQLMMLGRASLRAERGAKAEDLQVSVRAVASMLDIIESTIIEADDRDDISTLMATGQLQVEELMAAFEEAKLQKMIAPVDSPKPRVRRGAAK